LPLRRGFGGRGRPRGLVGPEQTAGGPEHVGGIGNRGGIAPIQTDPHRLEPTPGE
jgi:hypothetical protein